MATSLKSRRDLWLSSVTTEIVTESEKQINGFPVQTLILRTSFHKPLLRSETKYLPSNDPASRQPLSTTLSVANEFIARLAPEADYAELVAIASGFGAQCFPIGQSLDHMRIVFPEESDLVNLPSLIKSLALSSRVISYIEPDYLLQTAATSPNDPRFGDQSNLQTPSDADIDAPEAWDIRHDASGIVIAILDTGIRATHQDLTPNLWKNPLEIANGIDDDNNGIVDDLHGLNAISGNGSIEDDNGHGTHVAGIAGARGNNAVGIAGVAWSVQLMPLKFLDATGFGTTSDAIECLNYAIEKNAAIVNNSWGGSENSQSLHDTLKAASDHGILIATAAGNEGSALDAQATYPASYTIPNQVVTIAADSNDQLSAYSNFSTQFAHIAAPGRVLNTFIESDSDYQLLEGTSMATPQVAGALALLKSQFPTDSPAEIIGRLLDAVDLKPAFSNACLSGGRLNIGRALRGESNAPENDLFENATSIPYGGGRLRGSTSQAKLEPNEPRADTSDAGHTVWYRWLPSHEQNGLATLTPIGFAASISIYQGDAVGQLSFVSKASSNTPGSPVSLPLSFDSESEYFIQIDSVGTEDGPFSLDITIAPQNDDFRNPLSLSPAAFSHRGSNRAASTQANEAPIHISAAGSTVWFRWTPSSDGPFYLSLSQATGRMFARVFTGTEISNLSPVESIFEPLSQANQLFEASAGAHYFFAIDSQSPLGSTFLLEGAFANEPKLIAQPSDQLVNIGDSTSFTVSAFGLGTPTIQWLKDGSPINGATGLTLTIEEVTENDLGTYQARVSISGYTLYSREATLAKLGSHIAFVQQPSAKSIRKGETIILASIVAYKSTNDQYQWFKDGTPVPSQTAARLRVPNASAKDSGFYQLRVTRHNAVSFSKSAYVLVSDDSEYNGFAFANLLHQNGYGYHFEAVGDTFFGYGDARTSFSKDGKAWQHITQHASHIIKVGSDYLAATDNGIQKTSNLASWSTAAFAGQPVRHLAYGAGTYLARLDTAIYVSRDAKNWTPSLHIPYDNNGRVLFGNGLFVATNNGDLKLSEDGQNWRSVSVPSEEWYRIHFADGYWWMYGWGGSEKLYRSTDAETWKALDLPVDSVRTLAVDPIEDKVYFIGQIHEDVDPFFRQGVTYLYRIDGDAAVQLKHIHYSYDPIAPPISAKGGDVLLALKDRVVLASEYKSSDAWSDPRPWWNEAVLSYANDRFIATNFGQIYSSKDGTNWALENTESYDTEWGKFVYGNGTYVGENESGSSLNALSEHNQNLVSLAFGKNLFVGLSYQGVFYSEDGSTWHNSGLTLRNKQEVTFQAGIFVINNGENVYRSTNGINWELVKLPQFIEFETIRAGGGMFIAFHKNQCYTSTDGKVWNKKGTLSIPYHSESWVYDCYYLNGHFIAPYWGEYYFQSTDGAVWKMMRFTAESFGWSHRTKYASSGEVLLAATQIGIGVLGAPDAEALHVSIESPSRRVAASKGSPIPFEFDAQALESDLRSTEIYVDGQHWKTLQAHERRFDYTPTKEGNVEIEVRSKDAAGNQSSATVNVSTTPKIYTSLPEGEFWFYDLLYWKGAYYGASTGGRIFTSTNGIDWKGIQTPVITSITHLAATDEGIAARHTGNGILSSTNGIDWLNIGNFSANHVYQSNNVLISNTRETPIISKDGRRWHELSEEEAFQPQAGFDETETIVFNGYSYGAYHVSPGKSLVNATGLQKIERIGSAYVSIQNGKLYRSANLANWTKVDAEHYSAFDDLQRIGNLLFAVSNRAVVLASGDGKEWFNVQDNIENFLTYSPDGYYYSTISEYNGEPKHYLARSKDGITWNKFGPALDVGSYSYRISTIAASPRGVAIASTNGSISYGFVTENGIRGSIPFESVEYDRDIVEIIGENETIALTRNGSYRLQENGKWKRSETLIQHRSYYANGIYISYQKNGLASSTNNKDWSYIDYPKWMYELDPDPNVERIYTEGDTAFWLMVRYNDAGTHEYTFARTTDSVNWSRIELPELLIYFQKLLEFKGSAYIVGTGSLHRATSDVQSWTTTDFGREVYKIDAEVTASHIAVLTGQTDGYLSISVSSDGQSFHEHALPEAGYVELLASDEAFYLLGDSVWKSTDGVSWTKYLPYRLKGATHKGSVYFYTDNLCFVELSEDDLQISNASVALADYAVGDSLEIAIELTNSGSSDLMWPSDSRISYTLNSEPNRWTNSTERLSFSGSTIIPISSLDAGKTTTFKTSTTVPSGIRPGNYYLSAHIEGEVIAEDGNPSNDFHIESSLASIIVPARTLTVEIPENGSVDFPAQLEYPLGENVLLTAIPDFGYEFSGWTGDRQHGDETLLVTLVKDTHVSPSFSPRLFNLSIEVSGQGSISGLPDSGKVLYGEEFLLEATPKDGWVFIGWDGYGQSRSESLSARVGRDLFLKARFGRLFSQWSADKYGEDHEFGGPLDDADGTGLTNMERYAFGFDYPEQRAGAGLGFRLEGSELVLRYALYNGLTDFSSSPVWRTEDKNWESNPLTVQQVDQTQDLNIFEVRLPISTAGEARLLGLRLSSTSIQ
ncbi:S8 family serine peptidase [Pelagicoccus sp. SDUM812002]|uniref:S8 family serine peptidase n=1 Tax=Pelagicoccus sp. SDUM812002 TaxID=3041266 RepID=UPI00280D82B9|nr:S8 family serine peptidase [Pelagicoccus sp. SDUM812002]MDQ8188126.1 S8 family serine peptidase [Pelagicoccus sp. SDUM812002]